MLNSSIGQTECPQYLIKLFSGFTKYQEASRRWNSVTDERGLEHITAQHLAGQEGQYHLGSVRIVSKRILISEPSDFCGEEFPAGRWELRDSQYYHRMIRLSTLIVAIYLDCQWSVAGGVALMH